MPPTMTFALAPELSSIVRPGVLWLAGATVVDREPRMDAPLEATAVAMRAEQESGFRLQPEVDATREMYKRVGIDPTKRRPSSEALLRRVRKGEPFPRINSVVDVCNWCSLEFQLAYGLYDAAKIEGGVTLRIGHPGES